MAKLQRTVVYVAGPMTGLPGCNFDAFDGADCEASRVGYSVVNPAEFGETIEPPWHFYLKRCLALLIYCDAVATLDGWTNSRGAGLEVHVAGELGLSVASVDELVKAMR